MKFSPRDFSHLAKGALARGWAVAMPFYDLAPKASLGRMALQIESALRALTALDLGPMVVSGHSAGGHLAARMACTDIHVPMQRVVPISPLSDLEQIAQTDMNKTLGLNPLQVATQSPAHLAKHPNIDAHVWVGGIERPAFLWQARLLSEAWDCDWTVVRGRHHFDVIEDLTDPQSDFMNICLGGL
jgi:arylformamidase